MTPLQWLQAIAVLVAIAASCIAVARTVFVTEVKVAALAEAVKEVRTKADGTDKEVTGPHNMRAVKLEGQVANVEGKLDGHITDFKAFLAEYRSDQKGKRS